jgi:HK97 gp10 family phage protein
VTDGLSFSMSGLDKVLDRMTKLPDHIQKKLAGRALRKGANVLRDAARANARALNDPGTPEDIAKNIVVQTATRLGKQHGGAAVRVGVLGGAKAPARASGEVEGKGKGNPGGDTFHWRFLEFGTSNAPAKPIFRTAIASSESKAVAAISDQLNADLDKLERS